MSTWCIVVHIVSPRQQSMAKKKSLVCREQNFCFSITFERCAIRNPSTLCQGMSSANWLLGICIGMSGSHSISWSAFKFCTVAHFTMCSHYFWLGANSEWLLTSCWGCFAICTTSCRVDKAPEVADRLPASGGKTPELWSGCRIEASNFGGFRWRWCWRRCSRRPPRSWSGPGQSEQRAQPEWTCGFQGAAQTPPLLEKTASERWRTVVSWPCCTDLWSEFRPSPTKHWRWRWQCSWT